MPEIIQLKAKVPASDVKTRAALQFLIDNGIERSEIMRKAIRAAAKKAGMGKGCDDLETLAKERER